MTARGRVESRTQSIALRCPHPTPPHPRTQASMMNMIPGAEKAVKEQAKKAKGQAREAEPVKKVESVAGKDKVDEADSAADKAIDQLKFGK